MDCTEVTEVGNISNFENRNFMLNVRGNFFICQWLRVSIHGSIFMLRAGTRITNTEATKVSNIGETSNIRADGMLLGLSVNGVSGMLKASAGIAGSMRAAKASATDGNTNVMLNVRAN